jgi:hypothetical protein
MQKLMQICTLAFLAFLTIGQTYFPNSPVMMLTSSAPLILELRAAIVLGVLILALTRPPRTHYMRFILGVLACVLLVWAGYQTWEDNLEVLDGLAFLTAGASFGLASLELPAPQVTVEADPDPVPTKPIQLPLWS